MFLHVKFKDHTVDRIPCTLYTIIPKGRGNLQSIGAIIPLFWRGLKLQWNIMQKWGGVRDGAGARGGITEPWQDLGSAIFPLQVSAVNFRPQIYIQVLLCYAVLPCKSYSNGVDRLSSNSLLVFIARWKV